MILLGCHVSIAGGYHRAVERGKKLNCTALQIFTRNQLRWVSKPIDSSHVGLFRKARDTHRAIKIIFAHGSYLLNLASSDIRIIHRSLVSLKDELKRCSLLQLPYLVIHPGSHCGAGETEGVENIINCLKKALQDDMGNTIICIETTAGQGTGLAYRFEHIRDIIRGTVERRMGACMDTCHIFAAGYDIRSQKTYESTIESFDRIVGLENLKVLHLNDSKGDLGSRIDRHQHIGEGQIGRAAFAFIMKDKRFEAVPKIIETPKTLEGREMDAANLSLLRRYAGKLYSG